MATALGFAAAFLKSSTVDVAPKPRPTMNKKTKLSAVKALSRVLSTAMIATKDLLCPQGKEKLAITYFLHYIILITDGPAPRKKSQIRLLRYSDMQVSEASDNIVSYVYDQLDLIELQY